jgi:hypothetical protein
LESSEKISDSSEKLDRLRDVLVELHTLQVIKFKFGQLAPDDKRHAAVLLEEYGQIVDQIADTPSAAGGETLIDATAGETQRRASPASVVVMLVPE